MTAELSATAQTRIVTTLSAEAVARPEQIRAAMILLDDGATVPFIARYRKEVTGGLDDGQLRLLADRLSALRELEQRRASILESIAEQGKLDEELAALIDAAQTRSRLEDLYLPFKPRRRSKADVARDNGLEPLARLLVADPCRVPAEEAEAFVRSGREEGDSGVPDAKAALDGARDILAEEFAQRPDVLFKLQDWFADAGWLHSKVFEDKRSDGENFLDYFDYAEPISRLASHRALALFRGRQQAVLSLRLGLDPDQDRLTPHPAVIRLAAVVGLSSSIGGSRPADAWLSDVFRWSWRVKLLPHFESTLFARIRESAEAEAIRVFSANLKDLLLAPPAGSCSVIGLDPGIRTGVKVAVVDATGRLVETATLFPHEPRCDWDGSIVALAAIASRHRAELVAIGNGTASRETDRLVADLLKRNPELRLRKVTVSEAGASVYSASELAAKEMPDLDVSLRGAVSIARRLQDPLAELVKIDPKSIGVGQYQHDVNQRALARALDAVVEDCVTSVGVDLNTASAPLLARVSGLGPATAQRIVEHRDIRGPFRDRAALKDVAWLGDRAFEQAAGFLRIRDGDNPLDASAVHPEAYPVVERILSQVRRSARDVIGERELLRRLSPSAFTDSRFGEPTVKDILAELEKPGRDPRGEFVTANFKDGIESITDLSVGMRLQGVVTNVTNFGAFVDIGVHHDGLVHVSQLADRFVRDPREVVQAGKIVSVTVTEINPGRKRIALSMKTRPVLTDPSGAGHSESRDGDRHKRLTRADNAQRARSEPGPRAAAALPTAMAQALARAVRR